MSKSISLPITSESNPVSERDAVDYDRLIDEFRADSDPNDDDSLPDSGRVPVDDPSDSEPVTGPDESESHPGSVSADDSAAAEAVQSKPKHPRRSNPAREFMSQLAEISPHDLFQRIRWGSEKLTVHRKRSGETKWELVNELIARPPAFPDFVRAFTGPGVYYTIVQNVDSMGRRPSPRRVTITPEYWSTYVKETPTNQNPVNVHMPESSGRSDVTNEALLKLVEQQQSEIRQIYQAMMERTQSSPSVPAAQGMSDETRMLIEIMAERERRAEARADKLEDMFRASVAERVNQNPAPQSNPLHDTFDLLGKIHGMYSQLNPEAAESGPSAFVKKILDNSDSIANLMDGGGKFIGNMVDTVRGRKGGNQNMGPQMPANAGPTGDEEARLQQLQSTPWRQSDDNDESDDSDLPAPGTFSLQ